MAHEARQEGKGDASWTRRAAMKGAGGLVGGTALGTAYATAVNVISLGMAGAAPVQQEAAAYDEAMKKVVAGEPVNIRTFHLTFDDADGYDGDAFCTTVEDGLEVLDGLDVEVSWDEIAVTPETWELYDDREQNEERKMVEARIAAAKNAAVIQGYYGDSNLAGTFSAIENILEHYGMADDIEEGDLIGVVSEFGMKQLGINFGKTSFIRDRDSQTAIENSAVHEYAHAFGVEHAYNPFDVMSYSPLTMFEDHVRLPLTLEAEYRWERELAAAEEKYA